MKKIILALTTAVLTAAPALSQQQTGSLLPTIYTPTLGGGFTAFTPLGSRGPIAMQPMSWPTPLNGPNGRPCVSPLMPLQPLPVCGQPSRGLFQR
jgi:hypothetical protein